MLVGESPARNEDEQGTPFIGDSGQILRKMYPHAYYTNAQKCAGKPLIAQVRACVGYLQEEIGSVKPSQIVAVGAWADKILTEQNIPHDRIDHPAAIIHGRTSAVDWMRLPAKEPVPEHSFSEPMRGLDFRPEETSLALDLETISADMGPKTPPVPWFKPARLYCVGAAIEGWSYRSSMRLAIDGEKMELQDLLDTPNPKVFHNALYDAVWLSSVFGDAWLDKAPLHDTMWLLALRDEGGSRNLKEVGPYFYSEHLPKRSWLDVPPSLQEEADTTEYCANDAQNALALFQSLKGLTSHPLYQVAQQITPRLVRLSLKGIPLIPERVQNELKKHRSMAAIYLENLRGYADINWESPDQVEGYLRDTLPKRMVPSGKRRQVDEEALRASPHPAAKTLLDYRETNKVISTYLEKFSTMEAAHGLFTLFGASSGRTSSQRMNLQNIPKTSLREMFGRPEEDVWIKIDLKNAELLVVAVISKCKLLLEWFQQGLDPHLLTAASMLNKDPGHVTPKERDEAGKMPNFLMIYGGSAPTLQRRLAEKGIVVSLSHCEAMIAKWFTLFPEIRRWHNAIDIQVEVRRGVVSPLNQFRRVDFRRGHDLNMARNAPVQGTVGALLLMGVNVAHPLPAGRLVNIVHDEADFLVPKSKYRRDDWLEVAKRFATVHPDFPLKAELAVGPTWGEAVEVAIVG